MRVPALGHSRPIDIAFAVAACPLRAESGQARRRLAEPALCHKRTYAAANFSLFGLAAVPIDQRAEHVEERGFHRHACLSQHHESWRADWSRLPYIKPANFFPPVPLSLRMGTMMELYECATPCKPSFCCWRPRYPLARWHLPTTVGFLAAFFVTPTANSAAAKSTASSYRRSASS